MLILASSSPRRKELLTAAGIPFLAHAASIPEEQRAGEAPLEFARRLAREKAHAVWDSRRKEKVLGADTIVVVDGEVLGKPRDPADALRMLMLLSGRSHQVTTAVCLLLPQGSAEPEIAADETTTVFMSAFSKEEAWEYAAGGEPMDKAGAYAIQGGAAKWIYRIEGDYSNVVGLPVARVHQMLERARRGA